MDDNDWDEVQSAIKEAVEDVRSTFEAQLHDLRIEVESLQLQVDTLSNGRYDVYEASMGQDL